MKKLKRKAFRKTRKSNDESGVALFMVISALSLLTILVADLTYSVQVNSRLAYNNIDNLRAYYMAKTGFKLSLVRLNAFRQIKRMLDDPANKMMKDVLGKGVMDLVWSIPFRYPPILPSGTNRIEKERVDEFVKLSSLTGVYMANISGESSKLNLNNLFIKKIPAEAAPGQTAPPPGQPGSETEVNMRPVLESTVIALVENKKEADKEFADTYRNLQGKDIVDAIVSYLLPEGQGSNLQGYTPLKAKNAPFYSVSELHLVPGIDDTIFDLITPSFTVYSTPGVNVNKITKSTLRALIPELTSEEADEVLKKRDGEDPSANMNQGFASEDEFWGAIQAAGSVGGKTDNIKKRFKEANVTIILAEESFKIDVEAQVGLSTRRLEAYVVLEPKAKKDVAGQQPGGFPPGALPGGFAPQNAQQTKKTQLNLIYWRMI